MYVVLWEDELLWGMVVHEIDLQFDNGPGQTEMLTKDCSIVSPVCELWMDPKFFKSEISSAI